MDLREKAEELRKYADLEGTEIGELCNALIAVAYRAEYSSEEFIAALDKELTEQLDNFKQNATIVSRDETFTRKVIELEWNA